MKALKKGFALLLALTLVFGLAATAFAASDTTPTLIITDAVEGQTYSAYKLFDLEITGSDPDKQYVYTMAKTNNWVNDIKSFKLDDGDINPVFSVTESSADPNKYVVKWDEGVFNSEAHAKKLAEYLNGKKSGKTAEYTAKAEEDTDGEVKAKFPENMALGYYFVDSSMGSVCSIFNSKQQEIKEKNAAPKLEKKIMDKATPSATTNPVDDADRTVGDTVEFQIKVTAGGKADTTYVVHDHMSAGLTRITAGEGTNQGFTVKVNGIEVDRTNYSIGNGSESSDPCSFEITFAQAYTNTLAKDTDIIITYSATVNADAVKDDMKETNKAYLKFGESSSVEDIVTVHTYKFDLVKTDESDKVITGAEFKLYTSEDCTEATEVKLVKVTDAQNGDYYRPAVGTEKPVTIAVGTATIKGLTKGTYYLKETKVPAGYNGLDGAVSVVVDGTNYQGAAIENGVLKSGALQVENSTGTLLPSTGGMGTTLFYVFGGILMAGAVVLLITKKRMSV